MLPPAEHWRAKAERELKSLCATHGLTYSGFGPAIEALAERGDLWFGVVDDYDELKARRDVGPDRDWAWFMFAARLGMS